MDEQVLSELIEDAGTFESRGYSNVKVTKGGVEQSLKVPIKSTGVYEYQIELSNKAPQPPSSERYIKKDSKEGQSLGIPNSGVFRVFDFTDEKYVDEMDAHNREFVWKIAVFALDMPLKKKDGTMAESYDDRKRVLQSNGITGHQLDVIFNDVQSLTKWAEDRQDFLSASESD